MALIVNWHLSLFLLVAIPLLIVMLFVIMKTAGVKKQKKLPENRKLFLHPPPLPRSDGNIPAPCGWLCCILFTDVWGDKL
ncbi:hypothetical protein C6Y45_12440 [Alkalicoccus saliphilus]|uniref:Uncharacterized protein n=1 Tax=Alkalicoccus saliphilus TaxID=200989 RepID=A0A2T4U482_9BACI|nr:hypothetical protein C6Y45_12440 [Alkalicoccus saliphilus]